MDLKQVNRQDILLVLLPFWASLIPPMGIISLKTYLQKHHYTVKAVDMNLELTFREIYDEYLGILKECVPENKRRNLLNLSNDVLRNHMMAYLNSQHNREYKELAKRILFKTFYCDISDHHITVLDSLLQEFYRRLERYFLDMLARERPGLLGISTFDGTLPASLFVSRLTKERYPDIKIVMGGGIFGGELSIGAPDFDSFVQKTPYIDKIIIGEGEILLLKYLQGKLPVLQKVFTSRDIDKETLDLNLDCTGFLDFSDLDLQHYPLIASYTSRSCPFQCSFCSETMIWGKYRKRKAKEVVEELTKLSGQHKRQLFMLTDSLLNPVIDELVDECINRDVSIYWDGYLRVDKPVGNSHNTIRWRRGGFYRARLGLESGSERILKAMNKKITPGQMKEALAALANAGIKTTTYWVIGHPGETETDFQSTLDLVEELKDEIYEADCNPFKFQLAGQVNSREWVKRGRPLPLYGDKARDSLISQTWSLDVFPSREEIYRRVNRFVEHCRKIGIPNPYSLQEIIAADERWKRLHKNSVPTFLEFEQMKEQDAVIDENKRVGNVSLAANTFKPTDEEEWGFEF
jgi:hypothetical protein